MRYFDIQQNPECYRILNKREIQEMDEWVHSLDMPSGWGLDTSAHCVLGKNIRDLMNEELLFWVGGIPQIAFKQADGSDVIITKLYIIEVPHTWESIIGYLTSKEHV